MLRMGRLTDYGTVILACLANGDNGDLYTTRDVAEHTHLALTTVSKLLKIMTRAGLVESFRGPAGGYRLARPATEITAAQIIDALEGPVSITECSASDSHCDIEADCSVGNAWQRINVAIRNALQEVSLVDLLRSSSPVPRFRFAGLPITVEEKT